MRLEDELGADGEAGEEQGRGLQLLPWALAPRCPLWTLRADTELGEDRGFPYTRPGRLHSKRPRAQGFDSQADQLVHSFMRQTGNVHQVCGSVLSTSCAERNPHLKARLSVLLGADEKQRACLQHVRLQRRFDCLNQVSCRVSEKIQSLGPPCASGELRRVGRFTPTLGGMLRPPCHQDLTATSLP